MAAATKAKVRCMSCGTVDYPAVVRRAPGWLALSLWIATFVAWAVTWYLEAFRFVFWAFIIAALLYTMWYFYKKEQACRACGSLGLESDAAAA